MSCVINKKSLENHDYVNIHNYLGVLGPFAVILRFELERELLQCSHKLLLLLWRGPGRGQRQVCRNRFAIWKKCHENMWDARSDKMCCDYRNQDSSQVLQYPRDVDQVSPVITESEWSHRKPSFVCVEIRSVCLNKVSTKHCLSRCSWILCINFESSRKIC